MSDKNTNERESPPQPWQYLLQYIGPAVIGNRILVGIFVVLPVVLLIQCVRPGTGEGIVNAIVKFADRDADVKNALADTKIAVAEAKEAALEAKKARDRCGPDSVVADSIAADSAVTVPAVTVPASPATAPNRATVMPTSPRPKGDNKHRCESLVTIAKDESLAVAVARFPGATVDEVAIRNCIDRDYVHVGWVLQVPRDCEAGEKPQWHEPRIWCVDGKPPLRAKARAKPEAKGNAKAKPAPDVPTMIIQVGAQQ